MEEPCNAARTECFAMLLRCRGKELEEQLEEPREQLVFFIRHAESRWNRAQVWRPCRPNIRGTCFHIFLPLSSSLVFSKYFFFLSCNSSLRIEILFLSIRFESFGRQQCLRSGCSGRTWAPHMHVSWLPRTMAFPRRRYKEDGAFVKSL